MQNWEEMEDWGASANAPSFCLFKDNPPEKEALKDGFVDILIYNMWTKEERKTYQRLKTEFIANQIAQSQIDDVDDLAKHLDELQLLRENAEKEKLANDPGYLDELDNLIAKVEKIKLEGKGNKSGS